MTSPPQFSALLIRCPDTISLVPTLIRFFELNGIVVCKYLQYHDSSMSFTRLEWVAGEQWKNEAEFESALSQAIESLAKEAQAIESQATEDALTEAENIEFSVRFGTNKPSIGLFCSTQTHVIAELLNLSSTIKEPAMHVPFIISDDEQPRKMADQFGVPFFYISPSQPAQAIQASQQEIIRRYRPNLIGLARYDALLSQSVLDAAECSIVAVHNSFLPSVKSEKAYSLAYQQGLKLIGATARLVETKALGSKLPSSKMPSSKMPSSKMPSSKLLGPVIEQDAIKLGPGLTERDIGLLGQTIERKVFATAVRKLVEHKVMVYNAKTIVFD